MQQRRQASQIRQALEAMRRRQGSVRSGSVTGSASRPSFTRSLSRGPSGFSRTPSASGSSGLPGFSSPVSGSGYGSGRPFMRAASISNESRPAVNLAGRPVPMAPPSNSGTGYTGSSEPRRSSSYPLPLGNLQNGGYGKRIDRKWKQADLMQQRAEYYANLAQAYAAKAEIGGPFAFIYAMKARQFDRRHRLADRFARQHEARRMLLEGRLKRHIWQQQKGAFKQQWGAGRSRPISKLRFKLGW